MERHLAPAPSCEEELQELRSLQQVIRSLVAEKLLRA